MVETKSLSRTSFKGARPANRWGGGKYAPKRKFCSFCASKVDSIDYKDTALLARFISDRGKIEPRRHTGTCNRHQHALALAIKRARHVALLPFVAQHIHKQGQVPALNLVPNTPVTAPTATKIENTRSNITEQPATSSEGQNSATSPKSD